MIPTLAKVQIDFKSSIQLPVTRGLRRRDENTVRQPADEGEQHVHRTSLGAIPATTNLPATVYYTRVHSVVHPGVVHESTQVAYLGYRVPVHFVPGTKRYLGTRVVSLVPWYYGWWSQIDL